MKKDQEKKIQRNLKEKCERKTVSLEREREREKAEIRINEGNSYKGNYEKNSSVFQLFS